MQNNEHSLSIILVDDHNSLEEMKDAPKISFPQTQLVSIESPNYTNLSHFKQYSSNNTTII